MINMSRSKKQKDPIRALIRGMIFLAVAAAVCAAVFYGLNAFEKHTLDQKIKDTQAINQKREQDCNVALAEYQSATQKGQNMAWPPAKPEGWDVIDVSAFPLENTQSVPYDRATLLVGGMMLVNPWHALPADFPVEGVQSVITASGKKIGAANADVKLFRPAIDALQIAVNDASAAGIKDLFVAEGYRTNEQQTEFFETKKKALEDKYSGDTLIEMTKKEVNAPGTDPAVQVKLDCDACFIGFVDPGGIGEIPCWETEDKAVFPAVFGEPLTLVGCLETKLVGIRVQAHP
jgi:hypothetical protein